MEIDLTKDIDGMLKKDLVKYTRSLIQHIKTETKKEVKEEEQAEDFPYEGISVVDKKVVTLKFDLESKKARVVDVEVDTRDVRSNHMASYKADLKLRHLSRNQKEIINEEN